MLFDLRRVAAAKFLPAGGIVAKPFPQRGAGRYVLGPLIDGGIHLPDAARPQPIDQYPSAICCIGGFVRSFQFDVARRDSLTHRHRSEIMEATGLSPRASHPKSRKKPCAFFRCGDCSLEVDLRAKAFEIAVNDGDGQFFACAPIRYHAVSRHKSPVDLGFVPALRVSDIGDAEIVLFGPKERDDVEPFALTKNIARGGLPLALGDDEMLDADWLARQPIRPASDVAGREDTRGARLEVLVHRDAAINREPCLFRQRDYWSHADADDDEVGLEGFAILQRHAALVYRDSGR